MKREVLEWIIIVTIGLGLYVTGLHTQVIGFIQRAVLSTGIITPDYDTDSEEKASYNFELMDVNGESFSFEEYKGKTVFINFWATWCPPCIAEMPDINDLYNEVSSDVEFVIISVDENQEKAKRFVSNKGFDFPIYFPASQIPSNFKSNAIPTTLVISPDGRIVSKREGMAKYNTDAFKTFLRNL
ncbi:MAG: TlpA disulfide reductase family protein [Cyclobacteriaceae bacterium]